MVGRLNFQKYQKCHLHAYLLTDFGKGVGVLEGGVIFFMCDRKWTEVLCAGLSLNNAKTATP
jgi:hypothetical protein